MAESGTRSSNHEIEIVYSTVKLEVSSTTPALSLDPLLFARAEKKGLAKVTFNEISTDQSDSTTQILGSNLCVGGSLRVTVIAYVLLKDILKAWQQIKLEGDVDKVLDNDLAMLAHSSVIKNRERLYKAS